MTATYVASNRMLLNTFGTNPVTPSPSLYLGLSSTTPNTSGTGITEPSTGAYARVQIVNTLGSTNWGSSNGANTTLAGTLWNMNELSFPESTTEWAAEAAKITHVFLSENSTTTGTSVLYYAALTTSRAIPANTTVYFSAGALTISLV